MPSLPRRLADIRNLFQSLDWDKLSMQVEREAHARLAIVGPVNSGKSTLFNTIKGHRISAVHAVPGTTKGLVTEEFGPFTLVDTPGFGEVGGVGRAAIARAAAEQADEGRYTPNWMYRAWKGWSFADKKNPSPWLTFLALRVQGQIEQAGGLSQRIAQPR